jgi:hypothetical protein
LRPVAFYGLIVTEGGGRGVLLLMRCLTIQIFHDGGIMKRFKWSITLAAAFSLIVFFLNAAWSGGLTPCEVVFKYYHALQNQDYKGASECVSREMLNGKSKEEWAETTKKMFEFGKVAITEVSATPGLVSGQEAQVNSVVNSRDACNKDGLIEHNIEHLVLEDGLWKLDETELLDSPKP